MIIFDLIKKIRKAMTLGVLPVLLWAALFNVAFGFAFYYAERVAQPDLTLEDSLWWSMVTMTTVGYGDKYAVTPIGRFLISYPCMLLGIGVIGYLVGVVANYFIDWSARKRKGEMKIKAKGHVIICNFPSVEKILDIIKEIRAIPVYAEAPFVLITDAIEELPQPLVKQEVLFVRGSTSNEEILHRANILECAGVIILAEDPSLARSDDRTYTVGSLIELISKEHQREIKTVAELVSTAGQRTIARTDVDGTVSTEGVASCLLAQELYHPGVNQVINQMITTTRGSQLYLHKTRLKGKPIVRLQQAVLEHEANIQVIGIIHNGEHMLNPDKQMVITEGDTLIILAENEREIAAIERDMVS